MTMSTTDPNDLSAPTRTLPGEMPAPNAAIVKATPDDGFRMALEPQNFGDAYRLSQVVATAGMFGVKTPEAALVRIMTGRSLGIPTFIAMQHVYDVEGKPSISAKLKMALCLRHPDCEYFRHVSSDNNKATYVAKRRGQQEQERSFEVDDAKRAGLIKPNSAWEKWPRRMVQARASSELADILFPDATMGLQTREEQLDNSDPDELRGEVVPTAPPQAAPTRDFAVEAEGIKARIAAAATPEQRKAVRAEVGRFISEAPEQIGDSVKAAYNASTKPANGTTANGAQP